MLFLSAPLNGPRIRSPAWLPLLDVMLGQGFAVRGRPGSTPWSRPPLAGAVIRAAGLLPFLGARARPASYASFHSPVTTEGGEGYGASGDANRVFDNAAALVEHADVRQLAFAIDRAAAC